MPDKRTEEVNGKLALLGLPAMSREEWDWLTTLERVLNTAIALRDDGVRLDFLLRIAANSGHVTIQEFPEGFRVYTENSTSSLYAAPRAAIDEAAGSENFF